MRPSEALLIQQAHRTIAEPVKAAADANSYGRTRWGSQ